MDKNCVFCDIRKIKSKVYDLGDCVYFEPLNLVVKGHFLVISKTHTTDFSENPKITARVAEVAGELAKNGEYNLITSKGKNATQSINHLHIHLIPRKPNDNLLLPWSDISEATQKAEVRGRKQMGEYVRHFFGKKIYLPGDKAGQYIILNRTKKTHGRLYRLRVKCTLCGGVLYKTTQHLKQPHRPCKENDITEKNPAAQTIESGLQSGSGGE